MEIAERECALALLVESAIQVKAASPYCQAAVHAGVGVAVAANCVAVICLYRSKCGGSRRRANSHREYSVIRDFLHLCYLVGFMQSYSSGFKRLDKTGQVLENFASFFLRKSPAHKTKIPTIFLDLHPPM